MKLTARHAMDSRSITLYFPKEFDAEAVLKAGSVTTPILGNQAVTIPVSAFTAASIEIPDSVETTIQSCAITSTGAPIFIAASYAASSTETGTTYSQRLYKDEDLIYDVNGMNARLEAFDISNTPGVGSHTYYLKIYIVGDSGGKFWNRSLFLLETKK